MAHPGSQEDVHDPLHLVSAPPQPAGRVVLYQSNFVRQLSATQLATSPIRFWRSWYSVFKATHKQKSS
jgi:hypothetical protein